MQSVIGRLATQRLPCTDPHRTLLRLAATRGPRSSYCTEKANHRYKYRDGKEKFKILLRQQFGARSSLIKNSDSIVQDGVESEKHR